MLGSRSFPVSGLEGADYEDENITTCVQAIENGNIESKRSAACAPVLRDSGTKETLGVDLFIRAHALLALEAMGIKAIEGPIRGLKAPFPMNAYLAAVCLGRQGEAAIQALPALRKNLESPIHRIRQDENKAIQQIEKQEISTLPGLAEIKMRYAVGNTCYQT